MKTIFAILALALLASCSVNYQPEVARAAYDYTHSTGCALGYTPVLMRAESLSPTDFVDLDTGYISPAIQWVHMEPKGKFLVYHPAMYISLSKAQRRMEFYNALAALAVPCH